MTTPLVQPGRLDLKIELTLHTRAAQQVFLGKRPGVGETIITVRGINAFNRSIDQILTADRGGDVYATQALITIDDKLNELERLLETERGWLKRKMDTAPRMSIAASLSEKPIVHELNLRSRYAHCMARLIGLYDDLMASAISALNASIIKHDAFANMRDNPRRAMQDAFKLADKFKVSGTTRDDLEQGTARAAEAIEKFGEIPPDILNGQQRPLYVN